MRLRPLALAALLGLAGLSAPADAAPVVHVSGRVVDGAGKPVRGATVSFELHPDRTLYNQHDCPVRPHEIQCKVHKVARTTDAAGRYRLPVKLSSYLASTRSHLLVVTDRPGIGTVPARTSITTYFPRKAMDIADLPLWRGRATLEPFGPQRRTLHVDPLPASYGRRYTTGPVVELVQGDAAAWRFPEVTEDRLVDARLVESGTTAIRAHDTALLGRLVVTYRSTAYPVTGAVRPLSRGAACATYGKDDAVLPLSGCRFTDGKLAAPIDVAYQRAGNKACDVASQCDHPRWLRIDLRTAQPVGAVAVRGCAPAAAEVSVDGTAYTPYPTHDFGDGLLAGLPLPARYVRVDLGKCVFKATEVSVFGPA